MKNITYIKSISLCLIVLFFLNSCGPLKYRPVDAKEYPPNPDLRVAKNIEEGRGFRLTDTLRKNAGGNFEFASSNPLWRASLDTIDFMPLLAANYSGGVIVTDWYNDGNSRNHSVKISIRFLTNEIRVDSLDIRVFEKKCGVNIECVISENKGTLAKELQKSILKKAAIYEKEFKDTRKKKYTPRNWDRSEKRKKNKN